MRGTFLLVGLLLFLFNTLYAQQKLDYVWPLGYGPKYHPPTGIVQGGVLMDFNNTPPFLSLHSFISRSQKAGICNSGGQLLAYTDGCSIYNREHIIMLKGDSLNPGKVFEEFCGSYPDYPLWQGFLFLPKPGTIDTFCLLHLRDDDWLWNPMDLMYTIIDAKGDDSKGEVISKNQVVFSDSIWLGNYISATRHANGRDWWIVVPQRIRPGFHLSLLTPEGVGYKGLQVLGDSTYQFFPGQTTFSPDGSKYFRNWPEGLLMLDFDRCTGLFSNPFYLDYTIVPNGAGGVAVSPSGQYLYLTAGDTVHQYDLWAADFTASRQTVAEYDGYVSPFPTYFFQAMLAPDNKIYFTAGSSNNVLHVIHNPNESGFACNVEQHGVQLPALTDFLIPNFANYRLYDLPGSPCDTLGISVGTESPSSKSFDEIRIAPNPAQDIAQIQFLGSPLESIHVFDATGRWVQEIVLLGAGNSEVLFDVSSYKPGIYFLRVRTSTGVVKAKAFLVLR